VYQRGLVEAGRRRTVADNAVAETHGSNERSATRHDGTSTRRVGARYGWGPGFGELGLSLGELVRREAREILQRAIEAEVGTVLESFHRVRLLEGAAPWCATATCRDGSTSPGMVP